MKYRNGSKVALGDTVRVPVPGGTAKAKVVMLGETYEHLAIDERFIEWVTADKVLEATSIVIEWLGNNPFAHQDSRYAPVGSYMFVPLDEHVERDA